MAYLLDRNRFVLGDQFIGLYFGFHCSACSVFGYYRLAEKMMSVGQVLNLPYKIQTRVYVAFTCSASVWRSTNCAPFTLVLSRTAIAKRYKTNQRVMESSALIYFFFGMASINSASAFLNERVPTALP